MLGVLELASLHRFSDLHLTFFDRFLPTIGVTINAIIANSRTEVLLTESQRLATQLQERSDELQRQQEELRRSNAELEDKAALLAKQNRAIEVQNFQIDQARRTLEERAQQLAISSQYKSEFLANMSHELRTPLNSLLVLAKLLTENPDGNLTRQAGRVRADDPRGRLGPAAADQRHPRPVQGRGGQDGDPPRADLAGHAAGVRGRHVPADGGAEELAFQIEVSSDVPTLICSDEQRLQQILRNLLSNAVKFTATGGVTLRVTMAPADVEFGSPLRDEESVIAFEVATPASGSPRTSWSSSSSAFQQADGTTSRAATAAPASACPSRRDIARLLGGEIHATSRPGHGSTFTFYLPGRPAVAESAKAAEVNGVIGRNVRGLLRHFQRPAGRRARQ